MEFITEIIFNNNKIYCFDVKGEEVLLVVGLADGNFKFFNYLTSLIIK